MEYTRAAVARLAAVTAVVTSILYSGVTFTISKITPTTTVRQEDILIAKSGSGTGFACNGYGQCRSSGALTVQGVRINTGSVVTQSAADSRYVNTSGDTMTGALIVKSTLSGASLVVNGGAPLVKILSATAVLDFGNVATIGCTDLTVNVPEAALGDVVDLGVPNASMVANSSYFSWISSAGVATVRYCAFISGDPASGTFRVTVWKF